MTLVPSARMRVMFCHGLESGPHGRKYHALVDAGFDVISPDCQKRDLGQRVELIREAIVEHRPAVVVGSSFGGIAGLLATIEATRAGADIAGLLLCAPALQLDPPASFSGATQCPAPTTIIHGIHDEVIPIEVSRNFAKQHGATLVEVDDDHSLAQSVDRIVELTRGLGPG